MAMKEREFSPLKSHALYVTLLPMGNKHPLFMMYVCRCFLNPATGFIWAFIAPVIVIIAVTLVLFVIVTRVMWKHQKRMMDNTAIKNVT